MTPTDDQMDALQDNGIIADCCVTWEDVAEADMERALEWLTRRDDQ